MKNSNWECLGCEESNEPDADLCHLCGLAKNANFREVNQVRKEWLGKGRPKSVEGPPGRAADTPSDYAIRRRADNTNLMPDDYWECRGCEASNEPDAVVCHVCGLSKNANVQDGEQVTKVWLGKDAQEPAKDQPEGIADNAALWIFKALFILPLSFFALFSFSLATKGFEIFEFSAFICIFLAVSIGIAHGRALAVLSLTGGAMIFGGLIILKFINILAFSK